MRSRPFQVTIARGDRKPPSAPNDVCAMDFLSDQLFDGSKIRILTIVEAFSKLSPAMDVRSCYTGADVVRTWFAENDPF